MKLKTAIDKIRELKATAAIDITETDPRVRSGVEAQIRNAKSALPQAEEDYKKLIMSHIVLIGVHGEHAEEFGNIAKYAHKILTVDANSFYKEMEDEISKRGARKAFSTQEWFTFLEYLTQIKVKFGIVQLPNPNLNTLPINPYGEDTQKILGDIVKITYGNQLSTLAVIKSIEAQALKAEFTGNTLPVIVFSKEQFTLDIGMIKDCYRMYEINKEPTDDSVKAILSEVKKSLQQIADENKKEEETKKPKKTTQK